MPENSNTSAPHMKSKLRSKKRFRQSSLTDAGGARLFAGLPSACLRGLTSRTCPLPAPIFGGLILRDATPCAASPCSLRVWRNFLAACWMQMVAASIASLILAAWILSALPLASACSLVACDFFFISLRLLAFTATFFIHLWIMPAAVFSLLTSFECLNLPTKILAWQLRQNRCIFLIAMSYSS